MSNFTFKATAAYPDLNRQLDERYQVVKILVARPWGRTYLAQDLRRPSQPECVIHHLKAIPEISDYAEAVRNLFAREVGILEQLGSHEQIPQFLACFEDEYGFYVVQEFIPGSPLLLEFQPGKPWQAEQVIQLLLEVLEPLTFVHHHGSMHGNLKPTNLLRHRQSKRLHLVDFAAMPQIQQTLIMAHGLPLPEVLPASLGYQPLEQLKGLASPGSDVYALGLIAIQALTGIMPTQLGFNPNTAEILWKVHCRGLAASSHRGLIEVLDGMVQWNLSDRYATAGEVLKALHAMHLGELPETTPLAAAEMPTAIVAADGSPAPEFNGSDSSLVELKSAAVPEPFSEPEPLLACNQAEAIAPTLTGTDLNGANPSNSEQTVTADLSLSPDLLLSPDLAPTIVDSAPASSPTLSPDRLQSTPPQPNSTTEPVLMVMPDPPKPKRSPESESISLTSPVLVPPSEPPVLPAKLQEVLVPNPPAPPVSGAAQFKQKLATVFSRPSVRLGAGGTVLVTSVAAVGWTLISSTGWSAKGSQIWQRFTKNDDPTFQSTHRSVGDMTDRWRKDWQSGVETFGQAEQAMAQGKWGEAKQLAEQMPDLTYWKEKGAALAQQATVQAETESKQLVQTAFDRAYAKDFTKALTNLKQVVPGTSVAQLSQAKIQEYTTKQQIKAWADLQRAYDHAQDGDFTKALTFLWQIPEGTAPYATAQAKILEYNQKQKLRSQTPLKAAADQAQQYHLVVGLTVLESMPTDTTQAQAINDQRKAYTQQLNQIAEQWVQTAQQQAQAGKVMEALAILNRVPMGTPAYAIARDKIAELTSQSTQSLATVASRSTDGRSNLNPGSYLREASGLL